MKNQPGVIECLECHNVLVSNFTHDYVQCPCLNLAFVDGGRDYLRYGANDITKVKALKLVEYPKKRRK